jgi:hypothetical protein
MSHGLISRWRQYNYNISHYGEYLFKNALSCSYLVIYVTNGDSMQLTEGLERTCELTFESVARLPNIVSIICMISHAACGLPLPCYAVRFNQPKSVGRAYYYYYYYYYYFDCKWVCARWQWCYSKTQNTK